MSARPIGRTGSAVVAAGCLVLATGCVRSRHSEYAPMLTTLIDPAPRAELAAPATPTAPVRSANALSLDP